jgi:hypothetical protein
MSSDSLECRPQFAAPAVKPVIFADATAGFFLTWEIKLNGNITLHASDFAL